MAMSVTGGIIPAPGAVAVVGLAGLMGRRRRN
jgi:MYXO-CTERM domain-containing protein